VVGGRTSTGATTSAIAAIDLGTRHSLTTGHLPQAAVADSAVARLDGTVFLIGGWRGQPLATVVEMKAR
jgi:hypothetical protein